MTGRSPARAQGTARAGKRAAAPQPPAPVPAPPATSPRMAPGPRAKAPVPLPAPGIGLRLYTPPDGARKYITAGERETFLRAAEQAERRVRTLCMTLAYAGCRLSEALALTADRVDLAAGVLVFESLKKRRRGLYRAVPVPPALLEAVDLVHGLRELPKRRGTRPASKQ
jgi:integrase/recombinase XerD